MNIYQPVISGSLTVTGSTTFFGNITINSGSLTMTSGSLSGTASLASNALLLQGTGSVGFATTASLLEVSSSQQQISSSLLQVSASYIALSASYNTFSGSASTRITANSSSIQQVSSSQQQISASLLNVVANYATTGSNSFRANQSITGSLVVSSTITAQTLVVQTVTSSIVYSSGSNIFGNQSTDRQTFTGSILTSENVGLGITPSAWNGIYRVFQIDAGSISSSPSYNSISVGANVFYNAGNSPRYIVNDYATLYGQDDGLHAWYTAPSGTAGAAMTFTQSMTLTAAGNLGIGTATPLDNLHIAASEVGNVGISIQNTNASYSSQLRFLNSAGTEKAAVTYVQSTTSMNFNINSIESLVLASTGKVGIGTSTPTSGSLQVYNCSGTNHIALNGGSYPNTYLGTFVGGTYFANNYFYASGHASDDATKRSMEFFMGQDEIDINTMPAGSPGTRTRLMTISGSQGYVGIGTTTGNGKLFVKQSTVNFYDGVNSYACSNDSFTGIGNTGALAVVFSSYNSTAGAYSPLAFFTSDLERMRINSGGGVGIGGCAGANAKLHVFGDTAIGDTQSGGDIRLYVSGPSSTKIPGLFNNTQGGSGSENIVLFQRGGTTVGSISSTNTTTAYNTTSDYRLKEDLKEVSGLDKISAIKVYDFKWKSNDNRMDGVLAHELQQILPYAVIGEKDAEQMQGVDYSKLVPILVKGMQEQQCTICSQASMINQLKTCLGIS